MDICFVTRCPKKKEVDKCKQRSVWVKTKKSKQISSAGIPIRTWSAATDVSSVSEDYLMGIGQLPCAVRELWPGLGSIGSFDVGWVGVPASTDRVLECDEKSNEASPDGEP